MPQRAMGSDFFCGLTVPVGDSFCSLIVGGWGGSLLGISSLNGLDASENETTKYMNFESRHWYRIRLRVTEKRIQVWVDADKLVDVDTSDKKISLRPGDIESSKPFGLACWQTSSLFREIKYRRVDGPRGGQSNQGSSGDGRVRYGPAKLAILCGSYRSGFRKNRWAAERAENPCFQWRRP